MRIRIAPDNASAHKHDLDRAVADYSEAICLVPPMP
jgi:hypothetical protein